MSNKNICVVGAGYWGKNHIRTLYELGALGGIVDSDQNTLDNFKIQFPTVNCFLSLDDALEDRHFLGFTVATPAETHYKIAKKIILAKKHVLIEKPFTLNVDDAEELLALGEEMKINIMVGHVLLFHPAIRKIKKLIEDGAIGELQYLYSNRVNFGQVRTNENVLWSLAPHDIAIFQFLTDSFPFDISANGSTFLQEGIHDSTIVHLKYPNGVEGHIFSSWLHPFKEHRLVIIGSEAMVVFEDSSKGKPLRLYPKKFNLTNGIPEKFDGHSSLITYEQKMALTEELLYFSQHLIGKNPSIGNSRHAVEVTEILLEANRKLDNF